MAHWQAALDDATKAKIRRLKRSGMTWTLLAVRFNCNRRVLQRLMGPEQEWPSEESNV